MKKPHLLILLFLMAAQAGWSQPAAVIRAYVTQYKDIAIEEMKRSGVPASITLAQGIHETAAGQSVLVRKSNNHFGIKCKETWTGPSVSHDDDAPQECFRKYDNPFDSYRDHSDFLKTRRHYAPLFELDPTDYEGWAYGLKKAGYATNPKYPQVLIKLIKDYNLHDYTLIALGQKTEGPDALWVQSGAVQPAVTASLKTIVAEAPAAPAYPSGVFRINETKVTYVAKGTSYLSIAQEHDIPLARLFDFNDLPVHEAAETDGLIYLQRKRKTGAAETHKVAFGETPYCIAQTEGIRLESMLELNFLKEGMQPEIGETIYLHRKAPQMPQLASGTAKAELPTIASASFTTHAIGEETYTEHLVQPKETLYAVAKKYSVSIDDVMKWNELQDVNLKTGQALRIKK